MSVEEISEELNKEQAGAQEETTIVEESPANGVAGAEHAAADLSDEQRVGLIEALLLAHGEPLGFSRIQELLNCSKAEVIALVSKLEQVYQGQDRGVEVVVVGDKLQLRTKPLYAGYVRELMAVKPRRLSQAALETLSVIAYRQPVVKSEIDKIRGVDVAPTIKTLIERQLIKILGYQASVGQPALYGTTDEFLKVFGLSGLSELPSMQDLKVLAKEPGEAQEDGDSNDESVGESESLQAGAESECAADGAVAAVAPA